MSMLKRWWWVALAAVLVLGVAAYAMFGRAGTVPSPSAPSSAGITPTAPGAVVPSSTATEGASPASPASPGTPGTPGTPAKIAESGSKLTTVTSPPKDTLAQIRYSAARLGQSYNTAFGVYGVGPDRGGHGTIVVSFTSFTAKGSYDSPLSLKGANALLEPGPGVAVVSGGSYTGVVKLIKRGGVFVMELASVKAK